MDLKEVAKNLPARWALRKKFYKDMKSKRFGKVSGAHRDHIEAAPLVEICCITISMAKPNLINGKPCQIYGDINVMSEDGTFDSVYNRNKDDPEIVHSGGDITLIGSYSAPILIGTCCLSVNLWDKSNEDVVVAKGSFPFKKDTEDGYEEVICQHVKGEGGWFASVFYFMLPYAVMADLNITVSKQGGKDVEEGGVADVHGTILVSSDYSYMRIPCDLAGKYICSKLFSKKPHNSQKVKLGTCIQLSKSSVAVPAYSRFVVKLDLHDISCQTQIIKHHARFQVYTASTGVQTCKAKGYVIRVEVDYRTIHMPLPESSSYPRPFPGWYPMLGSPIGGKHGRALTEIFTVFIGRLEVDKALSLHGCMKIRDTCCMRTFFEKSNNSPEILAPDNTTLTLVGPLSEEYHVVSGGAFIIDLVLHDDDNPSFHISGEISWWFFNAPHQEIMFNRRISSVIPGRDGFAAIHYTVFSDALQASLTAEFSIKGSSSCSIMDVEGSIVARYSDHDYSTPYLRKYYQSVLFDSWKTNPLKVTQSCPIPLLKSMVVVPSQASLLVEANLSANGQSLLSSTKEIKIGDSTIILGEEDHSIKFDIYWTTSYLFPWQPC